MRGNRALLPAVVVENVRLASPIRGFARKVIEEREIGGVRVPAGARVARPCAAADLDETQFTDAERFDLHRPTRTTWAGATGPTPAWGSISPSLRCAVCSKPCCRG